MRGWMVVTMLLAALAAGCSGDSAGQSPVDLTQDPSSAGGEDGDDAQADTETSPDAGGAGTLDNPTPEGSGTLPENGIRIGDATWVRTVPITSGQCFVQEGEGVHPFAVWGTLDNDEALSFAVSITEDDSFSSEVTSDDMFWVAGQRVGSELTVNYEVETQTVSGAGIYNNLQTNEWAHGSFAFTCAAS